MVENRANFCKVLDQKPLFSSLYGMHTVQLNELKAFLKVTAQARQSGVVKKPEGNQMAQDDDFQDVKRSKRHISNNTLQTTKMATKPVQTSATVKRIRKSV
jgi:hypothetical protein